MRSVVRIREVSEVTHGVSEVRSDVSRVGREIHNVGSAAIEVGGEDHEIKRDPAPNKFPKQVPEQHPPNASGVEPT